MGCGVSSAHSTETSLINNGNMMQRNPFKADPVSNSRMISSSDSANQVTIPSVQTVIDKRNVLQLFNNLESTIQTMEESKCFEKYRIISDDNEQLKEQIQHFNENSSEINNRIQNKLESNKLPNEITLREIIVANLNQRDFSPKDTYLIELYNIQKINEYKINLLEKDIEKFNSEMKEIQLLCDQLHELYQQRDNVLNQVFEGTYGSEKEMQLEKELDSLMEERHYIEITKIRWINSDNLIIDALKCLDNGIEFIEQFHRVSETDHNFGYTCIKEARNNLVLVHYNLISLHNNLQNVQLPHCKIEELDELERQIENLFNDLSVSCLNNLIDSLQSLRTKMVTQHKWIKEVLNKTIKNDLVNIRDKCRSKSHELRFERVILIKHKQEQWQQQEQTVEPIKNDSPFDLRVDSGVDSELDDSVIADEQFTRILASGKNSINSSDFSNATPLLPGEELGPIPSNKEIFGKIIQIRNKHIREMQEFEHNQLMTRARMNQGLKEKLDVRRTRRNRLEMHKRQLEALQEYPVS